jgi:hypothetical protein
MFNLVNWYDWIRYSGAVVTIHLNPLHWWVWPHWSRHKSEMGERDMRWTFKFLFVKVSFWLDDGRW